MPDNPPQLADFGLTEARYQELSRAFSGAHSLLFLCVLLGMTFGFYLPIADKVEGWLLSFGLWLMCLLTGFLLMLFVSGLLRMLLAIVFKRLVPDYLAVMRYDLACRQQGRE
ncbi:MAG: hypothetical protein HUJ28_10690 [Chromatiales bacterium]|nr:hypothetical protein [Chromatiales bacterium]